MHPEESTSLEQLPVPAEGSYELPEMRSKDMMIESFSELLWNDYWLATADEKVKRKISIKRQELQVQIGRYFVKKEGDIRNLSLRRRVTLRLDMPSATSMSQINKHIDRSKLYYRNIWLPKFDLTLVSTPQVKSLKKKEVTFGPVAERTFHYTDPPVKISAQPEIGVSKDDT